MQKLLTISIPTYNRAGLLGQCLKAIISQIPDGKKGEIEIIVSNNASTDNTASVVASFQSLWPIIYFENERNLGPDANIYQCFSKASGRYVWVFSDDEVLLPGVLPRLLSFLESDNFGVVSLGSVGYHNQIDELSRYYNPAAFDTKIYDDAIVFFEQLNYMATFITGNIVNKAILGKDAQHDEFLGTLLVQLGWVIQAVFSGQKNAEVTTYLLGCKQENSGGYKLITIFAKNYNLILNKLVSKGIDKRIIGITNNSLLAGFFPQFVGKLLYEKTQFEKEDGFSMLFTHFWSYPKFWRSVFPIYAKFFIKKNLGLVKN